MGNSIYVAASGAEARLRQLEIVANNLANTDTDGYKAGRSRFQSYFESALVDDDGNAIEGATGGVYVGAGDAGFDSTSGALRRTGANLDVAIEGKGFFVVETEQGERFSRAGSFNVDAEGRLVTPHGHPVLGDGGPIEITSSDARILGNGNVVENDVVVGTLRVVEFEDNGVLSKQGNGLFASSPDAVPEDVERTMLTVGSVEGSNVQPVVEMANLVILQRAFEASMQAMQRDDQATARLIEEISR